MCIRIRSFVLIRSRSPVFSRGQVLRDFFARFFFYFQITLFGHASLILL